MRYLIALCAIAAATAAEPAGKPAATPSKTPAAADKPPAAAKKRWGRKVEDEEPRKWSEALPLYAQILLAVLAAELVWCSLVGGRSWLPRKQGCHVVITGARDAARNGDAGRASHPW